jgi:hypothetical protein
MADERRLVFGGRFLLEAVKRAGRAYSRHAGSHLAAAIAYPVLFSVLPLAILAVALFGVVSGAFGVRGDAIEAIVDRIPLSADGGRRLEELLRGQVGDERVDAALRGTDVALGKLEDLFGESGDARSKLTDVPENAGLLLTRARDAFERLRLVLGSSSRRAEEVSGALRETKNALDALSSALPEKK